MIFLKYVFRFFLLFLSFCLIFYIILSSNYMDKYFPKINNKVINNNVYFDDILLKPSMINMEYVSESNNQIIKKQPLDIQDLVNSLSAELLN